jgi:serine/threonine-protein kinase
VHRDIKPENVFVRDTVRGPFATLLDFGLARFRGDERLTSSNVVLGTPKYLAPELYEPGHEADAASDLYAAGALIFEMIAGKAPFSASDRQSLALRHLHDPAPSLKSARPGATIPDALEGLVAALLAKDPAQRPASARAVLAVLRDVEETLPRSPRSEDLPTVETAAGRPSAPSQLAVARPRRWIGARAAAVFAVTLLVCGTVLLLAEVGRGKTVEVSARHTDAAVAFRTTDHAPAEQARPPPAVLVRVPADVPAPRADATPVVSAAPNPPPARQARTPAERRRPTPADLQKLDLK